MATVHCTRRQLALGIKVPLDERTTIVVAPDHVLGTLFGRVFDAEKSFILPRAVPVLGEIFAFAQSIAAKHALVVAHADAEDDDADALTKERAKTVAAWLQGDPQPWLDNYATSVPELKRWGAREDRLMIRALPDVGSVPVTLPAPSPGAANKTPRDALVAQYQAERGLKVDGIAGPITRKQLIADYFALSRNSKAATEASESANDESANGESAGADAAIKVSFEVHQHGAGSNFAVARATEARREAEESVAEGQSGEPEASEATETTETPQGADAADAGANRTSDARLDFFFFMLDAGVDPAAGDPSGPEYLEWIAASTIQRDFNVTRDGDAAAAKLALTLFDRSGRTLHQRRAFTITGPEELAGRTNAFGEVQFEDVTPGDYNLELTLEFFEGKDLITDKYSTALTVLPGVEENQVRFLGAVPRVVLARLRGLLFDTNKAFLLPSALPDLQQVRQVYEQNNPSELLVVGHTDTTADAAINDPLSLDRAKSMLAFLQDDVDTWVTFYGSGVKESQRWGLTEDLLMLGAVLGLGLAPATNADVQTFQSARSISESGVGPNTRKALIAAYMALDGAELDSADFQIRGQAHGCGENFPLDDSGTEVERAPTDGKADASDRRVELFFFDTEFGVLPKPPGTNSKPGSTQYPTWRKQAALTFDSEVGRVPERPCHFSFILFAEDGSALSNAEVALEILGDTVTLTTDDEGFFELDAVPTGDFKMTVRNVVMAIPSLPTSESRAGLLVRPDDARGQAS